MLYKKLFFLFSFSSVHVLCDVNVYICVCRGADSGRNGARYTDFGDLEQSAGNAFHHVDAVYLTRSKVFQLCRLKYGTICLFSLSLSLSYSHTHTRTLSLCF